LGSTDSDDAYTATLNAATDSVGNDGASDQSESVTVDTTPPTISEFAVTNPSGQNVSVAFNSTEQLDTISVSISGEESLTLDETDFTKNGNVAYSYTAIYQGSSDGTFTATLNTATDSADNDGATSQSDSVAFDTTAPVISDFSVMNPTGQSVSVAFNSTEQLSAIDVTISGEESITLDETDFTTAGTSPHTYTAMYQGSSDGAYTATLNTANDSVDNDGASGQSESVTIDTTAPTISNFSVTNPSGQNVSASFSSTEQLGTIAVSITGAESATLNETNFTQVGSGPYDYTIIYNGSSDGNYTATLNAANDSANNDGSGGESGSVSIDTTAPAVSEFVVANPSNQNVSVAFNATEQLNRINVTITGEESTILDETNFTETGSGPYTYTSIYQGRSDGTYTATLNTANDSVDNNGASSQSDSVTVDTSIPKISNVTLDNDGSDALDLSFDSDTELGADSADISVSVDGPNTEDIYTFAGIAFTETEDSGMYTYTLNNPEAYDDGDGVYEVSIDDAINPVGNNGGNDGGGSKLNAVYLFDITAPSEITITNPEDGDRLSAQNTIEGTAVDNIEVKAVNLTIRRNSDDEYWNGTTWKSNETTVSASADSGQFNTSSGNWSYDSSEITADDTYTISANVIDTAGNRNSSTTSNYTLYTQSSQSGSSQSSSSSSDEDNDDETEVGGVAVECEESATPEVDTVAGTATSTFSKDSDVESVTFVNTDVDGDVTVRTLSSEPDETGLSPGRSARVTEIAVPDNAADTIATIRMRVTTDRLEEINASSDQLRINRYNDDDDGWQTLETRVTDENADEVIVEADTPGFSYFSVSVVSDGSSDDKEIDLDTDADTNSTEDTTQPETDNGTDADTDATDDTTRPVTEDDTPGFGISVVLVALIATGLIGHRTRR
jgi:PGF-pre-PGF domain-containing protein/PGF-CTERM protein